MQISSINRYNSTLNSNKNVINTQYSFKGENNKKEDNATKTATIVALGIAAVVTLAKNATKVKDAAVKLFKKHSGKAAHITIPKKKTELALSTDALRKLPKDIRRKAMEALNSANTLADKTKVIEKFGIGRYV